MQEKWDELRPMFVYAVRYFFHKYLPWGRSVRGEGRENKREREARKGGRREGEEDQKELVQGG
jgi:hypothetical protein